MAVRAWRHSVRLAAVDRRRRQSAVAVAIEVPHGPVVDALMDRGFVVHAINPKQLERLRDRVSLAGAKDDRRDARVAAGGLRTDPHLFRPVEAGDPAVIALREWSRLAEELQQERVLGPSPGLNSHFVIGLVIAASANDGILTRRALTSGQG